MTVEDRYALLRNVVRITNAAHLSYPSRLHALTKFLSKALHLPSLTVYLLDEDRRHFSRAVSSIDAGRIQSCHVPVGEGIVGQCAAKREALRLDQSFLHPDEPCRGDEEGFLAIPLIDCGAIVLGMQSDSPALSADVTFLHDLITPLEGLLQRIMLSEKSERRVRNLTLLGELGQLLNRPIPPREMVSLTLSAFLGKGDSCCVILKLLEEKELPAGTFKKCQTKLRPRLAELLELEAQASDRVITTGTPLLVCDLIADGHFPPSFITVPLTFKAKFLGTLTVFGKTGRGDSYRNFDEEDRGLFESIALLVANALAEAANYEQLTLISHENDTKVKELSLLYDLSNVMLSTIQLNKLTHLILTALVSGTPAFFKRAMLFLINERSGVMQGMLGMTRDSAEKLHLPFSETDGLHTGRWDVPEDEILRQQESEFCRLVRASRLPLNKTLNVCSRAVYEKKVVAVSDPAREKRIDRDFIRRFGITSFAVAPLMAKDKVIGVVFVDNPGDEKPISHEDLHFLQLFTNQAGMAIENSLLYNQLEDANRSLREARERMIHGARLATIGEMAATIAHELKGPLVSIGGFARRLEKKLGPASPELTSATTIVGEVQRLEKMLTDILSFSRKTTLCYNHCSLTDIIDDSLSIVGPAMEEKGISVSRNFPRKAFSFLGDGQQLKQVFINLFLNSCEAMGRGGTLDIAVSPAKLNGDPAVSVKITDSGGGIPPEIMNQIFNSFYTTKVNGTGLGLPIANRIVINHGGQIRVNNREGGAEFNVLLPLVG